MERLGSTVFIISSLQALASSDKAEQAELERQGTAAPSSTSASEEASTLMHELANYSPPELESLMKINSQLAEQNFKRHISWKTEHSLRNSKQAILAYDGAFYTGIKAEDLQEEELIYANDHVRILSGIYGALRPLDLIQPYRLEMLTKLKNDLGNNLYSFWRDKLTDYFMKEFGKQKDNVLINLASKEYSSAIDMDKINARV